MQVRDVMTPSVISVGPDASVHEAAQLMLQNNISGLPVVDKSGALVGIVTEGDFLRRSELGTQRRRPKWIEFVLGPGRLAQEYVRTSGRRIREVMTPDPHYVAETDSLERVVELMERHRVKRLPVVQNGRVVGIVSRANLLHALASIAPAVPAPSGDDAAIRDNILSEFQKQPWAPQINVIVKDGVAELWGVITDERERQGVRVAAENVAGVKKVNDHLVWVEPMSGMSFPAPQDTDEERG